jgi:hypothetical protein
VSTDKSEESGWGHLYRSLVPVPIDRMLYLWAVVRIYAACGAAHA